MANILTRNPSQLTPFGGLDDFDRLMDHMLGTLRLTVRPESQQGIAPMFAPKVDVSETENTVEVSADLPGLERDDVTLNVVDNVLTLQGEKKAESEQNDRTVYRLERMSGSFMRRISLPAEVDADKAEATFKNGVLHIRLPKAESSKPKQIAIQVG